MNHNIKLCELKILDLLITPIKKLSVLCVKKYVKLYHKLLKLCSFATLQLCHFATCKNYASSLVARTKLIPDIKNTIPNIP